MKINDAKKDPPAVLKGNYVSTVSYSYAPEINKAKKKHEDSKKEIAKSEAHNIPI